MRTLGLAAMTRQEDGPHPQRVDCLRQKLMRRGAVALTLERLEFLDRGTSQRMRDVGRIDTKVETWKFVGCVLSAGQRPDDIKQLLFG
ncbi:hypothetical protein [Acetobacter malorum]|uniref:hypothetical protein n=1 Tax=Acetobacter malorum TaxID=178901 RepID=UPI0018D461AF|nr:hypothetical protein [Acetobacter malorum]